MTGNSIHIIIIITFTAVFTCRLDWDKSSNRRVGQYTSRPSILNVKHVDQSQWAASGRNELTLIKTKVLAEGSEETIITDTVHISTDWHGDVNEAPIWQRHRRWLAQIPTVWILPAPDINTRLVSGEVFLYFRAWLLVAFCAKTSTPGGPVSPYLKGCLHSASVASSTAAAFKHARKTTRRISPSRRTLQMRRRQLRDSRQMQSC